MRPRSALAIEGRVNPKGISYLYLATDTLTAASEVRPWVGQYITIAKFTTENELNLIDLTKNKISDSEYLKRLLSNKIVDGELVRVLNTNQVNQLIWHDIDKAFSQPVEQADEVADYAPTQIIAEFIKSRGYDCIRFKSSVGEGDNIVLFDQKNVDFVESHVVNVKNISLQIECVPIH